MTKPQTLPQLSTTFTDALHLLERQFLAKRQAIENWFQQQWLLSLPPVYGSVDLRNAGFKLAPIDMNLFPAGFNNLKSNFLSVAVLAAKKIMKKIAPEVLRILVIPESHTRNLFYWENVKTLQTIFQDGGFEVRFGSLAEDLSAQQVITLSSGSELILEPVKRVNDRLCIHDFVPDLILLNNDLSAGIPELLQSISQPLVPPAESGWSTRLKSEHFQFYTKVAAEFAELVGIDPWLIAPLSRHCGKIDFMQQEGMECLQINAEQLFVEIQKKYDEYHIPYQPFVVIKADAGTYGMAVMTVRHLDELLSLNRKQRTRMASTKGGQPVRRVIIQEGVYTFESIGQAVAEPVVYLIGECVVGGFYRVHQNRGIDENLNAPGMHFQPIAFSASCNEPREEKNIDICQNRFYVYGIVAQLSMLAAAREIKSLPTNA